MNNARHVQGCPLSPAVEQRSQGWVFWSLPKPAPPHFYCYSQYSLQREGIGCFSGCLKFGKALINYILTGWITAKQTWKLKHMGGVLLASPLPVPEKGKQNKKTKERKSWIVALHCFLSFLHSSTETLFMRKSRNCIFICVMNIARQKSNEPKVMLHFFKSPWV